MNISRLLRIGARGFSSSCQDYNSYKFVVAGGGAGGIACAASLRRIFGKEATIAIIEPSQVHIYIILIISLFIYSLFSSRSLVVVV